MEFCFSVMRIRHKQCCAFQITEHLMNYFEMRLFRSKLDSLRYALFKQPFMKSCRYNFSFHNITVGFLWAKENLILKMFVVDTELKGLVKYVRNFEDNICDSLFIRYCCKLNQNPMTICGELSCSVFQGGH